MDHKEALEWLKGNRSMCNVIPSNDIGTWNVQIAQVDAAMMQQAYWVLLAYSQGLFKKEADGGPA